MLDAAALTYVAAAAMAALQLLRLVMLPQQSQLVRASGRSTPGSENQAAWRFALRGLGVR